MHEISRNQEAKNEKKMTRGSRHSNGTLFFWKLLELVKKKII